MVLETERLVESRRLLEAHARLMDLEQWQDDILWQLHGTAGTARSPLSAEDQELVTQYFSGVGKLVDALGERMDDFARRTRWCSASQHCECVDFLLKQDACAMLAREKQKMCAEFTDLGFYVTGGQGRFVYTYVAE